MASASQTPVVRLVMIALLIVSNSACSATAEEKSSDTASKPVYRSGDGKLFADIAVKRKWGEDIPRRSDVCFSSRFKHPVVADDPHDTLRSIREFHGTGLFWGYATDAAWIAKTREAGYQFQGALNPYVTDTVGGTTREKGRMVNQRGEKFTVPFLEKQQMYFGCVNNPEFAEIFFEHIKFFVDNGARTLMIDDPEMNLSGARYGGCYCSFCTEKAKSQKTKPTDEGFQRQSTIEFYRQMFERVDRYAKRHVPFACNNFNGRLDEITKLFDFGIAELTGQAMTFQNAADIVERVEQAGVRQLFTMVSRDRTLIRRQIANAYAVGSNVIVPWDVYLSMEQPRYFAAPEDYADLYGMIRAYPKFFDDYETVTKLGGHSVDHRFEASPVVISGNDNVTAVVRAVPENRNAPIVIHLIDNGRAPKPFTLSIDPARCYGDNAMAINLLTPAKYDAALHAEAEQSKNYGKLIQRTVPGKGYVHTVSIPALDPWGIVVVNLIPAVPNQVWPPFVAAESSTLGQEKISVRLESATKGSSVFYTVDGTTPTSASRPYSRPLAIDRSADLKATAVKGKDTSLPTSINLKLIERKKMIKPDSISNLVLWLVADDLNNAKLPGNRVQRWPARVGPPLLNILQKLVDGRVSSAPTLSKLAVNRKSVVRFRDDNVVYAEGFANKFLKGAFTFFMVTRSADEHFGACGTSSNGGGGIPRLYLTRSSIVYKELIDGSLGAFHKPHETTITTYSHDGIDTLTAHVDGRLASTSSGPTFVPPSQFGTGHLSIPFWSGKTPSTGDVAEIMVFDRELPDEERKLIQAYLATRYTPETACRWNVGVSVPNGSP